MPELLKLIPELLKAIPVSRLFTASRYRRFFEESADMFVIASLDGVFIDVNKAFCQALGYDKAFLTSVRFLKLVHPDDVEKTIDAMDELREGADVIGFQNRYRTAHGKYVLLEWRARSNGKIYAAARIVE